MTATPDTDPAAVNAAVAAKPISARRLAANWANAQRSTGPRTPGGKANSRLNAQTTGMTGSLLPIRAGVFREDPLELEALLDGLLADLGPRDALERQLAIQIATVIQRMKRTNRVDAVNFAAIGRLETDTLDTEEIHDATFNADLYSRATSLLGQEPTTLDPAGVISLTLAQAGFDPAVATACEQADHEDPDSLNDTLNTVLASITAVHGGVAEAQLAFSELADAEAAKVPDPGAEQIIAEAAARAAINEGGGCTKPGRKPLDRTPGARGDASGARCAAALAPGRPVLGLGCRSVTDHPPVGVRCLIRMAARCRMRCGLAG